MFAPSDLAGVLEYLWSRPQRLVSHKQALVGGFCLSALDEANRLDDQFSSSDHQFVVNVFGTIVDGYGDAFLQDDAPRINLFVKEKRSDARFAIAIDDGPVDGSCAAILRQKCSMEIECAKRRQSPNHLRQHAEGNDYLQVGLQGFQLSEESLVAQLFGLQDRNAFLLCKLLDGTGLQDIVVAANGFVGHRDDANHVETFLYESAKALHGKVGRAHEDDTG